VQQGIGFMTADFVRTGTVLDRILENTAQEVAARKARRSLAEIIEAAQRAAPPRDMFARLIPTLDPVSLHGKKVWEGIVSLIAEVKHASPSKGVLIEPFDPLAIAQTYEQNGAAAISVLTDEKFFQGHLDYLTAIRQAVKVPLLRKDFILDPYQVYEGRAAGADAILLITAALSADQLNRLHDLAGELGMAALVEVHNETELEAALRIQPHLLGINNRDLKTFDVDTGTTERLVRQIPSEIVIVAESGIHTADDVRRMGEVGAHAVLVGEALVKAADMAAQVRRLSGVKFTVKS
jgi:indole-3-glycerol phosphate synthase